MLEERAGVPGTTAPAAERAICGDGAIPPLACRRDWGRSRSRCRPACPGLPRRSGSSRRATARSRRASTHACRVNARRRRCGPCAFCGRRYGSTGASPSTSPGAGSSCVTASRPPIRGHARPGFRCGRGPGSATAAPAHRRWGRSPSSGSGIPGAPLAIRGSSGPKTPRLGT